MATKKRPTPVKHANPDEETYDLHPQTQTPVASFVPQMEATAIACVDSVLDACDRANDGDGFGAVVSGLTAVAYGLGFSATLANIAYTRKSSRRRG